MTRMDALFGGWPNAMASYDIISRYRTGVASPASCRAFVTRRRCYFLVNIVIISSAAGDPRAALTPRDAIAAANSGVGIKFCRLSLLPSCS